jgi:DNA-binding NtrC family response regulator
MKFSILVVDDEKNIRDGLAEFLALEGHETYAAQDGEEALRRIEEGDIDLVITDLRMPKLSGEELLKQVVSRYPTVPVIVLTGHGTVENAVAAMRDGAYDFVTKPLNLEHLALMVKRALKGRETELTNQKLMEEAGSRRLFSSMIGQSPQMKRVFELVQKVAPTRASVLITGESGVGKELVADAIHALSPRRDGPLVKVHCAALAETLLESELFGHEKGAFTGAVARKRGRFELAHEGSLFLDEIGEIDQNVQIKILRVLQERRFERVGGEETIETDVRIIAATNRDLKAEIEKGTFREDLYYRLNVINIHVPPLRERKDDIPLLAAAFLKEAAADMGKPLTGFDAKALKSLYAHSWPGNVRELRNAIESAVVMSRGPLVSFDDLPPSVQSQAEGGFVRIPTGASLEQAERILIRETLAANKGNKSRTAEILGIGRKTLYEKLELYGIKE